MRDARLATARTVVTELGATPGMIGAYLFGSATRPYADAQSDLDVGIVLGAAQLSAGIAAIQQARTRLTGQHVDLSYWADTLLARPREDADRRRIAMCEILSDPTGAIAAAQSRLARVPEPVRQARVRLHYFEVGRVAHLIHKAEARADRPLVRLLTAELVQEAAKLLFIERSQWPSPLSWMRQELELLDVSIAASLWSLLDTSEPAAVRLFRRKLDRYLTERGLAFVADPMALMDWYFSSEAGLRARAEWGSPARTG